MDLNVLLMNMEEVNVGWKLALFFCNDSLETLPRLQTCWWGHLLSQTCLKHDCSNVQLKLFYTPNSNFLSNISASQTRPLSIHLASAWNSWFLVVLTMFRVRKPAVFRCTNALRRACRNLLFCHRPLEGRRNAGMLFLAPVFHIYGGFNVSRTCRVRWKPAGRASCDCEAVWGGVLAPSVAAAWCLVDIFWAV